MLENWLSSTSKTNFPNQNKSPNVLDKINRFGQQKKHMMKTRKPLVVHHQILVVSHYAMIENANN
jgi:hypothetical protein